MRIHHRASALAAAAAVLTVPLFAPAPAEAAAQRYKFANCTALTKVYPHGVGRKNARDHTSGTPVTTFKRSTKLYLKIQGHKDHDRDDDGIACEKR